MLISEAEVRLKEIREKHGDIPIIMCWDSFYWTFETILSVNNLDAVEVLNNTVLLIPSSEGSYMVDFTNAKQ